METSAQTPDGWVTLAHAGLEILVKGDQALAERLTQALDEALAGADDEDPADVALDVLTADGLRRTPDFGLVADTEVSRRVVVRGSAVATLTDDGGEHEIAAPARAPWRDEDLDEGVTAVALRSTEAVAGSVVAAPAEEPAAEEAAVEPAVESAEEAAVEPVAPEDVDEPVSEEAVDVAEDVEEPVAEEPVAEEPAEEPADEGQPADEPVAQADEAVAQADEPSPETSAPETPAPAPTGGWALPSIFGAPAAPSASAAPETAEPLVESVPKAEPAVVPAPEPVAAEPVVDSVPATEQPGPAEPGPEQPSPEQPAPGEAASGTEDEPAPTATDAAAQAPSAPTPEEPSASVPPGQAVPEDEDEELPSFDFLFGNTSHHRSSLISELEEQDGIDPGPVAAAGGYQEPDEAVNATLAPPHEDDLPPADDDAAAAQAGSEPAAPEPGWPGAGVPPMPGAPPAMPGAPEPVAPAPDDAAPVEPPASFPQFSDGHLVGHRLPGTPAPAEPAAGMPGPAGPGASPYPGSGQPVPHGDAPIAAVPWSQPGQVGLPSFGQPAPQQAPQPAAYGGAPAGASPMDGGQQDLPAGPMVLAVRCPAGHQNAPHAARCRVCQQDLPAQQPEHSPRPALGVLRLSTGDTVTLDRSVLIGRSPKVGADVSTAQTPHLVRVPSPDNEISRNHAEISLDGWHVLVRDLGSTNGTTITLPGDQPVRLRPGDQQSIEPGTTITLADQVSIVFEVTG